MPYTMDANDFDELVADNPNAMKILAEGDSWFAYPPKYIVLGHASNVVAQLGKNKDMVIYSSASSGDEAVSMLSGAEKRSLCKHIKENNYDFLLFSGGGNDIVGSYDFDFLLQTRKPGDSWESCINEARLTNKLEMLRLVYEELIERIREYAGKPEIKIITHTYDLAIPSMVGFKLFNAAPLGKSWMGPFLSDKGIKDPMEQQQIVKHILGKFREMLLEIQTKFPDRFYVVDTWGSVRDDQWLNEIHPTPEGFKVVAERIATKLRELWKPK